MTLLRDSEMGTEMRPVEDILEREAPTGRLAPSRAGRIHWLEWLVAVAFLVGMSALAIWMVGGEEGDVVVEESSPLVLGARLMEGRVYTPEFVGLSGGDLPVVESSPLVLGVRLTDGTVFVPEYVGFSGGDIPFIESSPWILGPRHQGVVHVPAYVGSSEAEVPSVTP